MIAKNIYNTVWKVVHSNPNLRVSSLGEPIKVNDPVLIEHCATSQLLASDKIAYGNDYGVEYEVSACSHTTNNKTQQLSLEKIGKLTIDQPTKHQLDQNTWFILTATDPSLAEPIPEPPKRTTKDIIEIIKSKLKDRGLFGIRGLTKLFKSFDKNGNKKIDPEEFSWGLKNFDIFLSDEESKAVIEAFDTNRDGTVSIDEFITAIRGDLNSYRLSFVKKAYNKLDVNQDGQVKLDDIAKLYDVSQSPEVLSGKKHPKDVYLEFMRQWDTQEPDGVITFEEFADYFSQISASIDSDEAFAMMMIAAWKLY